MTSNRKIIEMISSFTLMHELAGEIFKQRAYEKAIKTLQGIEGNIEAMTEKELLALDGIGKAIASKIREFVDTGEVQALNNLQEKTPLGLRDIMSIDGVGPKTAKLLYEEFGVDDVEKLEEVIKSGKLTGIKGIGKKTIENMEQGIERFRRTTGRSLRAEVEPIAAEIMSRLQSQSRSISEISTAGSLRRKKESIGDIDILIQSPDNEEIMQYFVKMKDVEQVLSHGDKKSSVIIEGDVQLDLRVIEGSAYYSHLQYFTGSKEHNIRTRQIAIDKGYKLNEYGLFKGEQPLELLSEASIYEYLGMDYILPELREDRGEIEAARARDLPNLITLDDVKADFHVHSRPDDPALRNSNYNMESMVKAAIEFGHDYVVFTDHTQDLAMVFGYDEEDMQKQIQKVRDLDDSYQQIDVFIGAELNIREDGTVDLEEETLNQLDFAIASIHSHFNMDEREITNRIASAMEYPAVKAIAHPTTREFRKRDPLPLLFDEIVEQAIQTNTALEINGSPGRMDLSDEIIHRYRDSGVKFTLGSDAHLHYQLENIRFAVDQARRGWLSKDHVINTLSPSEFKKFIT